MYSYLEPLILFFLPLTLVAVIHFCLKNKKWIAVPSLYIYAVIIGTLSIFFWPKCLCDDVKEALIGLVGFSVIVNLILLLIILLVFKVRLFQAKREIKHQNLKR